jgi:hypothetical protein
LIGLLFLVATAAMPSVLSLDSGSNGCAVIEASPSLMDEWIEKADTPAAGGYGEAVVGTGKNIVTTHVLEISRPPHQTAPSNR